MSDCDHMCAKCDGKPCIEFRPKMVVPRELQTDYEMMATANLLMAASIESIKRKDEQLKAENAKLREERREYQTTIDSLVDECADHKAENAKLKEHIADLWEFGFSKNAGANSIKEYLHKVDELRDRTYELLGVAK